MEPGWTFEVIGMACDRKTLLLISCYADGEATPEEAEIAARHLAECAGCRKLVGEWQGGRQMLEWACAFEVPEEVKLEDGQMAAAQRTTGRIRVWPRLKWNWRLAGALAAVVAIGLAAYWSVTLPPILPVGRTVATRRVEQAVRVGSSVHLTVGPDSKVARIDDRSIKLAKGWVAADVRHGFGFTVVTNRFSVHDQGTRFRVGASPEFDWVTVEEGAGTGPGRRYQQAGFGRRDADCQGR